MNDTHSTAQKVVSFWQIASRRIFLTLLRCGSSILLLGLLAVLGVWYWSLGSVSVGTIIAAKAEAFYWTAITISQTLGTALGDWNADSTGLGYNSERMSLVLRPRTILHTVVPRIYPSA
jgi:uncharacterized membrane-anchored protein